MSLMANFGALENVTRAPARNRTKCLGPPDHTAVTVMAPNVCVLHKVLFLPCHRTRLVTTVFEVCDMSLRMCILAPYFEKQ